jgi:MFS transporter, OFA family, oxalate/formate antiporter
MSEMILAESPAIAGVNRWWQLGWGLVCMMAISSSQYVWTLFTTPLTARLNATLAEIQVTFSVLIVLQTFLSPFQGYLVDVFGPRILLSIGAMLTGLSWVLAAGARTSFELYLTYGLLGGIGTGIIYVGVVGLMARWFPDRRGLVCGIVAAGYGMGAIITTYPIASAISRIGYQQTLVTFGAIFGVIGILAAQGMRRPPYAREERPTSQGLRRGRFWAVFRPSAEGAPKRSGGGPLVRSSMKPRTGVGPGVMLVSPVFWVMFLMMTMMSTSGLMVISQMAAFAKDFGVANAMVFGTAALPLALTIDRFTNGLTRPFFGWLSDRIGREQTMTLAFGLEGVAMFVWLSTRENPLLFVLLSGVVFFGWGEIFSLFPSTLTDTFGERHATTNYGFLYMAQGIGSVLGGPLAAWLHEATKSWIVVFSVMIVLDLVAAVMAVLVLRPLRVRAANSR